MKWVVTLSGSARVLEELSKVFITPDICIRKASDSYVLTSRDFSNFTSDIQVQERANEILTSLNGAAKFALNSRSLITIRSISEIHDGGSKYTYVSLTGSISVVSTAHAVITLQNGGTIKEYHPADPAVDLMMLSMRDIHVKKLLHLIENDFETWHGLYKIYEVIQEDIGNIPKRGWCTQGELNKFKQTANSSEALGVNARHGKMIPAPPNPMSLSSAKSLLKKLVSEWLKEKKIQYNL